MYAKNSEAVAGESASNPEGIAGLSEEDWFDAYGFC
jgi:hypothetical protein